MSEAARINLVDRAPLTEKQQNVYESIMQYQRVNGYAPTIREICKMVGVASTSSVYAHLKILEEKGYIARKMDYRFRLIQHFQKYQCYGMELS
jgi:SOS-response transcriptional repressor LexA